MATRVSGVCDDDEIGCAVKGSGGRQLGPPIAVDPPVRRSTQPSGIGAAKPLQIRTGHLCEPLGNQQRSPVRLGPPIDDCNPTKAGMRPRRETSDARVSSRDSVSAVALEGNSLVGRGAQITDRLAA